MRQYLTNDGTWMHSVKCNKANWEEIEEVREWCKEHCTGRYLANPFGSVSFQKEKDAVFFTLVYGNEH